MSALDEVNRKAGAIVRLAGEAVDELQMAQRLIADLQQICGYPTLGDGPPAITCHTLWHRLESIDDCLHEALSKLGD